MRSYRHDPDVDAAFNELVSPLEDILKEAEIEVTVPSDPTRSVARALPSMPMSEIVWEYAPELGLDRDQRFIDRVYETQFGALINTGIRRRCLSSPHLAIIAALVALGMYVTDKLPELRLIDHPGLLFGLIALLVGMDLRLRLDSAQERVEVVKRSYAQRLRVIAERSEQLAQGLSPLDELSCAALGNLLYTYVGLRYAGCEAEAERLLPLYRLCLAGQYLLGFHTDEQGATRALMTPNPTEQLEDDTDDELDHERRTYDHLVSFFNTGAAPIEYPIDLRRLN